MLEGTMRELVSKIQTMRKDAGFEVTDHIEIGYVAENSSKEVLENGDMLKVDVLADSISEGIFEGYTKEWNINGDNVTISIRKK